MVVDICGHILPKTFVLVHCATISKAFSPMCLVHQYVVQGSLETVDIEMVYLPPYVS